MDAAGARELLGLAPDERDDQTIRRAYLRAIKSASPEREPERFQALREAYECLRDRVATCAAWNPQALDETSEREHHEDSAASVERFGEHLDAEQETLGAIAASATPEEAFAIARRAWREGGPWASRVLTETARETGHLVEALELARAAREEGESRLFSWVGPLVLERLESAERDLLETLLPPGRAFAVFLEIEPARALSVFRRALNDVCASGAALVPSRWTAGLLELDRHGGLALAREGLASLDDAARLLGCEREDALSTLYSRGIEELLRLDALEPGIRRALVVALRSDDPVEAFQAEVHGTSGWVRRNARIALREKAPHLFRVFGPTLADRWTRHGISPGVWAVTILIFLGVIVLTRHANPGPTPEEQAQAAAERAIADEEARAAAARPTALQEVLCREPEREVCREMVRLKLALSARDCITAMDAWARLEAAFADSDDPEIRALDPKLFGARRLDVYAACGPGAP